MSVKRKDTRIGIIKLRWNRKGLRKWHQKSQNNYLPKTHLLKIRHLKNLQYSELVELKTVEQA